MEYNQEDGLSRASFHREGVGTALGTSAKGGGYGAPGAYAVRPVIHCHIGHGLLGLQDRPVLLLTPLGNHDRAEGWIVYDGYWPDILGA